MCLNCQDRIGRVWTHDLPLMSTSDALQMSYLDWLTTYHCIAVTVLCVALYRWYKSYTYMYDTCRSLLCHYYVGHYYVQEDNLMPSDIDKYLTISVHWKMFKASTWDLEPDPKYCTQDQITHAPSRWTHSIGSPGIDEEILQVLLITTYRK